MKKRIISAACIILSVGLVIMSAFLINDYLKVKEYKNLPLSLPRGFTVTAHTGCEGTEENSLNFLEKALSLDVEIIEFDVSFDENENPVLAHDTPKGGEVELSQAFDLISKHPNVRVNVDIKETTALDKIEKCAEEYGVLDQIFFTGVKDEFLDAVKEQTENVEYYLNVNVNKRKAKSSDYLREICDKVKQSGAIGINFKYTGATRELVEYFHNEGLLVSIWTVDKEKAMHEILSLSPDNITTRNPVKLREIINGRTNIS